MTTNVAPEEKPTEAIAEELQTVEAAEAPAVATEDIKPETALTGEVEEDTAGEA